jgi:hypothetical protein
MRPICESAGCRFVGSRSLLGFCLGVAVLSLPNCSARPAATVQGTVRLDGKPLPDAALQLWPKDDLRLGVYHARTDRDGRFRLKSREGESVQPGRYVVLVFHEVKQDGTPPDPERDRELIATPGTLRNTLPGEYSDRAKPRFVVEVEPGGNDLPPFDVKSQP